MLLGHLAVEVVGTHTIPVSMWLSHCRDFCVRAGMQKYHENIMILFMICNTVADWEVSIGARGTCFCAGVHLGDGMPRNTATHSGHSVQNLHNHLYVEGGEGFVKSRITLHVELS